MKALRIAAAGIAGIYTAAAAAQPMPTPPAPPPPIIMTSPASSSASRQALLAERRKVVSVDVEVRGGRELLWAGNLRVATNVSGDYTQSKREAWPPCPGEGDGPARYLNRQSELRVSLNRRYGEDDADGLGITVNWGRPVENCTEGQGSRTVAIMQSVTLAPGATREVQGDGGLVVRVTRRP